MTELTIHPEQLTQASSKLTTVAGDMASDVQALQNTIVGSGSPWGADDAGSVFGMLYQVVLGKAWRRSPDEPIRWAMPPKD
jgi:hypothetical protein